MEDQGDHPAMILWIKIGAVIGLTVFHVFLSVGGSNQMSARQ
jgi:hypothetical protein